MEASPRMGGCRSEAGGAAPLLTVIVVVFRDCAELARLLSNLAPFRGDRVEVVVVDGGSDDGSVELLRERQGSVDFWLSESDSGLYEAMNKGLAAARGRFVLHINAGDRLLDVPFEVLEGVEESVDVVAGRVAETNGRLWSPRRNWRMRFENAWHHQGTFYRRDAHLRYDTSYRIFGDFDLNQRMLLAGKRVMRIDTVVAQHEKGGLSSDSLGYREMLRMIGENYGPLSANMARGLFFLEHHYWQIKGKLRSRR